MDDLADLKPFPDGWERALYIVAHPDDIEWSGSSAVAAWTAAGRRVEYLLVTRGEAGIDSVPPAECGELREAEQRAAATAVGVEAVEFLGYPDGRIEGGLGLRRDLAAAIRRVRPEVVVTLNPREHWGSEPGAGWNSADHRAVGVAVLDAVSDAGNRWIFPELLDDGLDPWPGTKWIAVGGSATPTHAVDVTGYLDHGIASLAAHARYIEAVIGQDPEMFARSVVTGQAQGTSKRFGGRDAIAFELVAGS